MDPDSDPHFFKSPWILIRIRILIQIQISVVNFFTCKTQIFEKNPGLDLDPQIFQTQDPDLNLQVFEILDTNLDPDPPEIDADPKPCLLG